MCSFPSVLSFIHSPSYTTGKEKRRKRDRVERCTYQHKRLLQDNDVFLFLPSCHSSTLPRTPPERRKRDRVERTYQHKRLLQDNDEFLFLPSCHSSTLPRTPPSPRCRQLRDWDWSCLWALTCSFVTFFQSVFRCHAAVLLSMCLRILERNEREQKGNEERRERG